MVGKARFITLPLALVLLNGAAAVRAGGPESTPVVQRPSAVPVDTDVRGLWVLRTTLTSPQSITEMVRTAHEGGFNTLLVQVRGRGEAYYASAFEPRATDLDRQPASFDPLALVIQEAHRSGLRVHAWVNVNLVSSAVSLPRSRDHIATRHPEWLMLPRALAGEMAHLDSRSPGYIGRLARWTRGNDQVEGLYLSPITAGAQAYATAIVTELVSSYALDGLHLDYLRYPSDDFDYSRSALAEFRAAQLSTASAAERQRIDRAADADATAWAAALPDAWSAFRRERLTALLGRVSAAARAARQGLVISAAVAPNAAVARDRRLQDWSAWASAGLLDVICPMAYATELDEFTAQLSEARVGAHGLPVWAGIGAYRLPVGQTAEHVRVARRGGSAGVLVFSYDSLLSAGAARSSYFTQLRPALLQAAQDPPGR